MSHNKWMCGDWRCGWVGSSADALKATNPFDTSDEIWGCPKCKTAGVLVAACDEPGCNKCGSCGTPTDDGYRLTCFIHRPELDRERGV